MHEALIIAVRILEGAFLAGMLGSAILVVWVATEDLRELGKTPKTPR